MDRGFRSSNDEMLENVTFDSVTFVEETLPINDGEFCCGSDGVTLAMVLQPYALDATPLY